MKTRVKQSVSPKAIIYLRRTQVNMQEHVRPTFVLLLKIGLPADVIGGHMRNQPPDPRRVNSGRQLIQRAIKDTFIPLFARMG